MELWVWRGHNHRPVRAYIYTDRPVYRPGHTVHIKAIVRKENKDALDLPDEQTLKLTVTDADNKTVLKQDVPVSAHGTVTADLTSGGGCGLGLLQHFVG